MTSYERTHGGRTPAEDGEAAARDEARRQDFLRILQDPAVRKAAIKAAEALSALDNLGVQVVDYATIGGKVTEVELESTMSYEKAWIKLGA